MGLYNTKLYVSAKYVHDIRVAYEVFEDAMYQCRGVYGNGTFDTNQCYLSSHGHSRGKPEALPDLATRRERLEGMSEDDQGNACRIPFTMQFFLFTILLIWSLTCGSELKKTVWTAIELGGLKRAKLRKCFEGENDPEGKKGELVIVGLPCWLKSFLLFFMLIRFVITCVLLWIGCRWLLSTTRFADLILNAVAL